MTRPGVFGRLMVGLAASELPLVLLVAPALLFPSPTRVLLALLVPLTWLAHRYLGGPFVPHTPLNASLLLLVIMVGISLGVTFDVRWSLDKVSGVALGVLLFFAITRWSTTPTRLRLATGAFLLAGALLGVIGLLGTSWFDKFHALSGLIARLPVAIRGVPSAQEGFNPNAVAGCLVLFLPLHAALLVTRTRADILPRLTPILDRWRFAMQVLLFVLVAGVLVLTQARGAWIGTFAAALACIAWHSRLGRSLAMITGTILAAVAIWIGPARVLHLAVSRSGTGMASNVASRPELWSRAISAIQDFPLTGMGMNVFRKAMPVLYPVFSTPSDFDVAHAHNHLLQAALDVGLPGLVAYLSIWIVAGVLLVRVYRQSGNLAYRTLAGGLGAGLIAHFVFSLTDAIPLGAKVGVLFWLTLSLVVSLHHVAMTTDGERNSKLEV